MAQADWTEQVATIKSTLYALEERVAHGDLPRLALEEFKSAVDDIRLRVWGLLAATSADENRGFQERFRIRRAKEMCRAVGTDLRAGTLSGRHPELAELQAVGRDLIDAVDVARRQAF